MENRNRTLVLELDPLYSFYQEEKSHTNVVLVLNERLKENVFLMLS